jgi:solute carrier family 25 (mitochondrial aspartate/glutamate transporter), member 12/13
MYKGNAATLLRDVPFSIFFFTLNCKLKEAVANSQGSISAGQTVLVGTFAGIIRSE